ncbi:MAG: hypothetical protein IKX00_01790 [Bacilli bacterium]|nr:hypothetical protein [Bacilli bacterium]
MKAEETFTIDYKYKKALEYLEEHDTIRVNLFGIDITNFKNISDNTLKQQVIDIVEILQSMKKENISRRRKDINYGNK